MEQILVSEKNSKIYEESEPQSLPSTCVSCKNKVSNKFAYSCESCGSEFDRCVFSGLSLTSNLHQTKPRLSHYQLHCSQCKNSGFLLAWMMRDFSQNCVFCEEVQIQDKSPKKSQFSLKVMIK